MSKKFFTIYGNCQSAVLARFMRTSKPFSEEWEYIEIPGIHEMTNDQLAEFKSTIPELSLLVYQNVQRGEFATGNILPLLPGKCERIGIPSLFFNGYNPEVAYLRQSRSTLFYHDRIMLEHIDDFDKFQQLLVREDYFPPSFSEDCLSLSLQELENRERQQKLEITISDFIAENYRSQRLFHVLNHPSAILVREVAARILVYLGYAPFLADTVDMAPLDRWQFPIYRSHYQNLGLEFSDEIEYLWAGTRYSVNDFFAFRKQQYASLDLEFAKSDAFIFRKPVVRGWDLAGELQF